MATSKTNSISSTLVPKIYKSRKYLLEQLEERGFNISEYNNFDINDIHNLSIKKQLDMLVTNEENEHKVYVKYHLAKNLMPTHIYSTITDLFDIENILKHETDQIIFVVKSEPNDTLVKTMEQIYMNDNVFITIINIERLQFNVLKHSLVPKHTILSLQEKQDFIAKFNIQDEKIQIPLISRFDPVVMAIGMRPGDICKIIRPSKTAITSTYYRICI